MTGQKQDMYFPHQGGKQERGIAQLTVPIMRSPRYRFHKDTKSLEVAGAQQARAPVSFMPEHVGLRELTLGLKPTQREVIDLLYFGGCTQVEAAEQLGIPRATVTRARAALVVLALLAGVSGAGAAHGNGRALMGGRP